MKGAHILYLNIWRGPTYCILTFTSDIHDVFRTRFHGQVPVCLVVRLCNVSSKNYSHLHSYFMRCTFVLSFIRYYVSAAETKPVISGSAHPHSAVRTCSGLQSRWGTWTLVFKVENRACLHPRVKVNIWRIYMNNTAPSISAQVPCNDALVLHTFLLQWLE
jgi:hypothetical protein